MTTNLEWIEEEIRKREREGRKPHYIQMGAKTLRAVKAEFERAYWPVRETFVIEGVTCMIHEGVSEGKIHFGYREK